MTLNELKQKRSFGMMRFCFSLKPFHCKSITTEHNDNYCSKTRITCIPPPVYCEIRVRKMTRYDQGLQKFSISFFRIFPGTGAPLTCFSKNGNYRKQYK